MTHARRGRLATIRQTVTRSDLRRIARYLAPWWRTCAALVPIVTCQASLALVPALLFRGLVSGLQHHSIDLPHIVVLVLIGLAAALLGGLLGVLETFLAMRMSFGVVSTVRRELFNCLLRQPLGFFTRTRAGEITSRLFNDIGVIEDALNDTLVSAIRAATGIIVALIVMFVLTWQLTLCTLLAFPLLALGFRLAGGVMFRANLKVQERLADLSAYAAETLGISGLMLIKAFGIESRVRRRFSEVSDELATVQVQAALSTRWFGVAVSVLQLVGPAVIVLVGGALLLDHQLSLATLLTFIVVASARFAPDLQGALSASVSLLQTLAAWSRVFTVLDGPLELPEPAEPRRLTRPSGAVALEHVTFSYDGQAHPALSDVCLEIEPGELIALVGPSGAGKTTLSMLVPRFHDPSHGRVTIDGIDVRDISPSDVAAAVGLVLQDSFLFNTTLRENLLIGRPDANDTDLVAALSAACLLDVLDQLPDGLNTTVGERGHHLSGGERQRVAIARVILRDPPILILDEATSHLDSRSEHLVQEALSHLFAGRTAIVIAHRLSTVRSADRIVVLDGGRVVQHGPHAELLERDGLYSHLHALQFATT